MRPPAHRDALLPGLEALRATCRIFGVDATGARLMHHRSNAVYRLPRESSRASLRTPHCAAGVPAPASP